MDTYDNYRNIFIFTYCNDNSRSNKFYIEKKYTEKD